MTTRPFIDTFRAIESGILLDALADKQQEIVDAVRNTHKVHEAAISEIYEAIAIGMGAGQILRGWPA